MYSRFHQSHAHRTLHVLCGVLARGKEDGGEDVARMSIETTNTASHGTPNQILLLVEVAQIFNGSLQHLLDDLARNDSFSDNALAASLNPIDCSGLLVRAVVAREREDGHTRELLAHDGEGLLDTLGDHVHAHSVTSRGCKPDIQRPPGERTAQALQPRKARGRVERIAEGDAAFRRVDPPLRLGCLDDVREFDNGPTGHCILREDGGHSPTSIERFASTRSGRDERPFRGGHWDRIQLAVDFERARDPQRNRHVPNDIFTAGAHDT